MMYLPHEGILVSRLLDCAGLTLGSCPAQAADLAIDMFKEDGDRTALIGRSFRCTIVHKSLLVKMRRADTDIKAGVLC